MIDNQEPQEPAQAGEQLQDPETMTNDQTQETDETDAQESLSIAWTGGMSYAVFSDGDDGQNAYKVNLSDLSCTCDHAGYNEKSTEACYHIKAAIETHDSKPDLKRFSFEQLADLYSRTHDTLTLLQQQASGIGTASSGTSTESSDGGSDGESSDTGSSKPEYRSVEPNDDQYSTLSDLEEWFEKAAGFNGFDGSIIELEYAEYDGVEGIHVNRNPFISGYYDTDKGEWSDSDGFDEEKDTIKESILSPRDEFQWIDTEDVSNDWDYGKWFIPARKVSELVE